jgi:hypothetical protein
MDWYVDAGRLRFVYSTLAGAFAGFRRWRSFAPAHVDVRMGAYARKAGSSS